MKKVSLLSLGTLALFISSCSDSQFEGYEKAENGLHYKFFTQNEDQPSVHEGDGITVRYVISKEKNDSVLVSSKDVSSDGTGSVQFGMTKSSFSGSFEDGLMMMHKGDSAAFIISADSFFLKTNGANALPEGFKPGEFIKGVFKINDIKTKAELAANQKLQMAEKEAKMKEFEAMEKPAMEKYLADNKITTKPTASGLYYIETKKGTGANPTMNDIVKVHYTGKFLNGEVFDSSIEKGEPVEFRLDQVIAGWTEAIMLMKKGGKAHLVIPSSLAYGPGGRPGIHPYAPLTFEVELLDITVGGAAAQQMPQQMPPSH